MNMGESQLDQSIKSTVKITAEKIIPSSEITTALEQYQKVFDIPQQAKDKVLKTEVSVIPENELIFKIRKIAGEKDFLNGKVEKTEKEEREEAAVYEVLGTNPQQVEEKNNRLLEQRLIHLKNFGGVCIKEADGQTQIFIKESSLVDRKTILAHESLHAAADGFQAEDGAYHYLNEAAVEVLRIAGEYQDISAKSLLQRIDKDFVPVYYKSQVRQLLAIMIATDFDKEPVDVKRLAHCYFQNDPTGPIILLMEISQKTNPQVQKNVKSIVEKFF